MSEKGPSQDENGEVFLKEQLLGLEDPLLRPRHLSNGWRIFVAVLVAVSAAAGGALGVAVAKIGCVQCGIFATVAGGLLGGIFAGIGMAVLGVLIARSFEEWSRTGRKSTG